MMIDESAGPLLMKTTTRRMGERYGGPVLAIAEFGGAALGNGVSRTGP